MKCEYCLEFDQEKCDRGLLNDQILCTGFISKYPTDIQKNNIPINYFRHRLSEKHGNCPYVVLRHGKVPICAVDGIIGVEFYGCVPDKINLRIN